MKEHRCVVCSNVLCLMQLWLPWLWSHGEASPSLTPHHTPHPLQDSVARSWVPATKLLQAGGQPVLTAMGSMENRGIELTPYSFKQCEGLYDTALLAV